MPNLYILQNNDWSCTISPDFGSNVISLRHHNYPVLREPKCFDDLKKEHVLYGFPILLPPNRTANGKFCFNGIEYHLPINEPLHYNHLHGNLHSAPFDVLSYTQTELLTQFINDGTFFPFPFKLEILDHLQETGFIRTLTIKNIGTSAMPLVLGFHTAFTAPRTFSVPIGDRWCVDEHYIPTGVKTSLTNEQLTYRSGCNLSGQKISGFFESVDNIAYINEYQFEVNGFDQWILFNGNGKQDFLCVEPQLGSVNALNSGGYVKLEPAESYICSLRISYLIE